MPKPNIIMKNRKSGIVYFNSIDQPPIMELKLEREKNNPSKLTCTALRNCESLYNIMPTETVELIVNSSTEFIGEVFSIDRTEDEIDIVCYDLLYSANRICKEPFTIESMDFSQYITTIASQASNALPEHQQFTSAVKGTYSAITREREWAYLPYYDLILEAADSRDAIVFMSYDDTEPVLNVQK